MRGRYIGPVAVSFEPPVGAVRYGDVFELPPGREQSFLQHGHIEPADKAAKDFLKKDNTVPTTDPEPDSSTD